MAKDWTKIFKKYKGLWVALADDEETVLGAGKTLKEAFELAKKKGYKEPIMTRMPEEIVSFVGAL
ncbi:MAG: hypothetical protein A3C06_01200 [Candidatus Taylorbacteria bacterium RIFCSPHIGHO2_02_FULL_46_13]|uniref:DUF5678 domain-containing protein n=1 Tax=Candidatus Taylorbacteria bacterium RIFCSPHIGHO2_02_FULL_46_13 TaxID=1802312 RepID=A0A1G2MUZ6_9BACT|nr:MAG: hypothetical protein A3C06_01200 [Candidatus Taylorbacteria bacterium RIFCSPHIGHO2_02_FULL_46_13]